MSRYDFGVLRDLKVISAGSALAGPYPCALFSEMGADVIHVESSKNPDFLRNYGRTNFWPTEHRNQRGISLDIPSERGREILFRLLKDTDILVESSKGGTWAKWGLTDEVLWEHNPKLVILHVSGYGQSGDPDFVFQPSYDPVGQAFSGYPNLSGEADGPPMLTKSSACDFVTGLFGAWSTLAAYIRVQKTGKGESIDLAQYEAMLRITDFSLFEALNYGTEPTRFGNGDPDIANDTIYRCKDGWVLIIVTGATLNRKAVKLFGLENDPDFQEPLPHVISRKNESAAAKWLKAHRDLCASHTTDEIDKLFREAGLPVAKVIKHTEMATHPHYIARQNFVEWHDAEKGKVKGTAPIPKFKREPGKIVTGSPKYSQHTEEVLAELGYTKDEIENFYEGGIVKRFKE